MASTAAKATTSSGERPPVLVALAALVRSAARDAVSHRWSCGQMAEHVGLVEEFLQRFVATDLMRLPEVKAETAGLEEGLRRAVEIVEGCGKKSYLYMVAVGWDAVYQFRQLQAEIDGRVKTLGSHPLVEEFHMEHLKGAMNAILEDHREYSLDEEEIAVQIAITKPDRTREDADIIDNTLARAYPDMNIHEAMEAERSKLQVELLRSDDPGRRRLVEHLIGVAESAANDYPARNVRKILINEPAFVMSGYISNASAVNEAVSWKVMEARGGEEWRADLFNCCAEPCLTLKACVYPCGLFAQIASAVSRGKISRESAISDLLAYSIFCGCCCYSCWIRRKLRELFNIEGGACDDFTAHLMCFCCAMVQEWRELELRGFEGCQGRKMVPPPYQYMKP